MVSKNAVVCKPYLSMDPYAILADFAFFTSDSRAFRDKFSNLDRLDFNITPVDRNNTKEFDGRII